VPVIAPIKSDANSSSTSLIKREKRRGDTGLLFYTSYRHSGITSTGSFGTIDQNILVSIVHLFDNIDKVSVHPDII
jgi:hypothetical protein